MSFLSDLIHGNFGNLGTDVTHAFEGPELTKTLEGLGGLALAGTGIGLGADLFGLGTGGLTGLFSGAGDAGGLFGGLFGGGDAAAGAADAITGAVPGITADGIPGLATGTGVGDGGILTGGSAIGVNPADYAAASGTVTDSVPGISATGIGTTDTGTGVAAPASGSSSGSGGGFWNQLLTGATKSVTNNPLGIAAAGAGLGLDLIKGNQPLQGQAQLEQQAQQLSAQGTQLEQYLQSGTLPPALQAALGQATAAAKARIMSKYAANGQSTDPAANSALAQELNQVDIQAVSSMGQIEQQLLQTGINETGLSSQLYQALVGIDQTNNNALMQAIASFAGALGGKNTSTVSSAGKTISIS